MRSLLGHCTVWIYLAETTKANTKKYAVALSAGLASVTGS
jgi:hypothetical protein